MVFKAKRPNTRIVKCSVANGTGQPRRTVRCACHPIACCTVCIVVVAFGEWIRQLADICSHNEGRPKEARQTEVECGRGGECGEEVLHADEVERIDCVAALRNLMPAGEGGGNFVRAVPNTQ